MCSYRNFIARNLANYNSKPSRDQDWMLVCLQLLLGGAPTSTSYISINTSLLSTASRLVATRRADQKERPPSRLRPRECDRWISKDTFAWMYMQQLINFVARRFPPGTRMDLRHRFLHETSLQPRNRRRKVIVSLERNERCPLCF